MTTQVFGARRRRLTRYPWVFRARIKLRYALIALGGAVLIGVGGGGVAAEVRATNDPSVRVAIAGQSGDSAVVPTQALVREDGLEVAYVEISNHVFRQQVETGGNVGGGILVLRGVSPGSFVVLSPDGLHDGQSVRVQ